jgi:phenylacetate-coenzyme A ligase PaaK-like adenylate-forming protein
MSGDWRMELYWRLPVSVQETVLSLYAGYLDSLYYGPGYREALDTFSKLQTAAPDEIAEWQDVRLRRIIEVAATEVSYYRELWEGRDWRSIKSAADLPRLPRLDKQTLRGHEAKFRAEKVNVKSLWLEKTSGTTGTSLSIYWPKAMLPQWWALVEVAIRRVAGVAREMPRAMMGGRTIVRGDAEAPPYWRYNRRWRQLYLSSYHVSRASAPGYIDALRRYDSQWITGYGSAIAALAQFALDLGLKPLKLRAAVVSGDTLVGGMRRSIEAFFGCPCYDSYGQSEGVSMAMECPRGEMHVISGAGIMEILHPDGSPCRAGEVGEIVATGVLNDVMPLIRYRMGDYAAWQPPADHHPSGRALGRLSNDCRRPQSRAALDGAQAQPDHPLGADSSGQRRSCLSSGASGSRLRTETCARCA